MCSRYFDNCYRCKSSLWFGSNAGCNHHYKVARRFAARQKVNCYVHRPVAYMAANYCQMKQCTFWPASLSSLQGGKPLHCSNIHHWIVNTVQRSPFSKDIILTTGGWHFAIGKEEVMVTTPGDSTGFPGHLTCSALLFIMTHTTA